MKYIKLYAAVAAVIFIFSFSQLKVEASQLLRWGSTGSDVTYVQSVLKKMGYFNTSTTGFYGNVTASAVEQFQQDFGIPATGQVGSQTAEMINNAVNMAHVVHGEARGESYQGQVAVAAVILNRMASRDFPDSIDQVIFQRNAFTAVYDGQYYLYPDSNAYQAVKDAYLGWDPTNGALYYYNPRIATNQWIFTRTTIKDIGNHRFAY
ncbi:cell wall hydrolase [Bacillus sp. FJAT-27251]|uniref:cell wall hydrolase n=1 Tax=Bacillus sp. FJAT-27251 TaxID=1684142 RepID=UPI0006A7609C|nr:cell wall hydrolase [Bacillus sp. FJAT-27251]